MNYNIKEKLLNDLFRYYNPTEARTVFYRIIEECLFSRINPILSNCESYIFEKDYVENQWKEMVSIHYINTSYKIKQTVARIHFFDDVLVQKPETYLGYITLRPFSEYDSILSTIAPNFQKNVWTNTVNGEKKILSYKQNIHINGLSIVMDTFLFFSQDGVVARCAHADVLMLTNYLNHIYGYKKLKLSAMNKNYLYSFPNDGLDEFEIVDLLEANDIPARIYALENKDSHPQDTIKTYVESGLPVIIGYDDHVILVIGVCYENNNQYSFIIYDDSGSFVSSNTESKNKSFISIQKWENIQEKKHKCMIVPIHERLYMQYPVMRSLVSTFLNQVIYGMYEKEAPDKDIFEKFSGIQTVMVETGFLKTFLKKYETYLCDLDNVKKSYKSFKKNNKSHYIWATYFTLEGGFYALVLTDPTRNPDSMSITMPFLIFKKEIPFHELKKYLYNSWKDDCDEQKEKLL